MSTVEPAGSDIVVSLARGRYAVMSRANALLGSGRTSESPPNERDLAAVSGLLMTALEELKVAEEELRAQNATLEAQRAGIDERTRHYRTLFMSAPLPAFITDAQATIIEANVAAGVLTRRAPQHLERKPLAALVPIERRDVFRQEFTRLTTLDDGVRDWCFSISRSGDVPVDVHATVKLIPELGPTRAGLYYWMIHESAARTN